MQTIFTTLTTPVVTAIGHIDDIPDEISDGTGEVALVAVAFHRELGDRVAAFGGGEDPEFDTLEYDVTLLEASSYASFE